jgi:hypothetical protein
VWFCIALPLLVQLPNVWDLRSWRFGLLSVPFALHATVVCFLAGVLLAVPFDQRRRQVLVAADGLHTRRLFRSASVGWDDVRDVQVRHRWDGDFLVVATAERVVRLDVPYLLVRSDAARRDFEVAAAALQRAMAEHGLFMPRPGVDECIGRR